MRQVIIENPIINSLFQEPPPHFRFSEGGITDQIEPGRRPSRFFVPIPKPEKNGNKCPAEIEWSAQRAQDNEVANHERGPCPPDSCTAEALLE